MRAVIFKFIAVGILISGVACTSAQTAKAQEDLQAASEVLRQQKKIYIANTMELNAREKESFWALYAEYESGLSKLKSKRMELALGFLQRHGSLSDAEAIAMLKQKLRLDGEDLKFKQTYVAKFMQVLPGRKVVRFYQVENKFDTAATAELYRNIPVIQ